MHRVSYSVMQTPIQSVTGGDNALRVLLKDREETIEILNGRLARLRREALCAAGTLRLHKLDDTFLCNAIECARDVEDREVE
jgi:hypothetical protein